MKYPLLALLAAGAAHGYQLKRGFESRFGAVWPPVNIGQIYTTLQRLERDGLVRALGVERAGRQPKNVFEITEAGLAVLGDWLRAASPGPRIRDEFFMKLILARLAGIADPLDLLGRQREAFLQELRDLNDLALRQETGAGPDAGVTLLLIEGVALHLQADLKWLDICEERLRNGGTI